MLSESDTYFRKIRIHILQCDDKVQSDVLIECAEDLKAYMEHFQITGFGGTDFRPAFEYVNELRAKREVDRLRGLIYFTDGKGSIRFRLRFMMLPLYLLNIYIPMNQCLPGR